MRNYHFIAQCGSAFLIDFTQSESQLLVIRKEIEQHLLALFETKDLPSMTVSESDVMDAFRDWYHLWEVAGARISVSYPRLSLSSDLPVNTLFTYVNVNTGRTLTLIGEFNDGYGDRTLGLTVLP